MVVVQLLQHILLNELGDHIVGGDNDIVVRAAAFEKGVEGLVALRGLVVHPDARLLLKLVDEVRVDILPPTAHVDHRSGVGLMSQEGYRPQEAGNTHRKARPLDAPPRGSGEEGHEPFPQYRLSDHSRPPPLFLLPDLPHVGEYQQNQHRQKQEAGDRVDLRRNPPLGHAVDGHGQGGGGGPGGEVGDHEVVDGHGEGDEGPGDDAGPDLRQDHLPEGLHPGAAQILGGVHQVPVHLPELGGNIQDDVGNIKGDVGQEQRPKAQCQPVREGRRAAPPYKPPPKLEGRHKEQAQRHARHNVRVHHGDVVHRQENVPPPLGEAVEPNGGEGPGGGGDDCRQQGDEEGHIDTLDDEAVLEQGGVPVEGEALPHRAGIPGVEGEDDQQEDGGVQEEKHQGNHQAAAHAVLVFHALHLPLQHDDIFLALSKVVHHHHAEDDDDHHHHGNGGPQVGVVGSAQELLLNEVA